MLRFRRDRRGSGGNRGSQQQPFGSLRLGARVNYLNLPKALRDHRNDLERLSEAFGEVLRIETLDGKKYRLRSEAHSFSDVMAPAALAGFIGGMVRAANILRQDTATAAAAAWRNRDAASAFLEAQPEMADAIGLAWALHDPAQTAELLLSEGHVKVIADALAGTDEAKTVVVSLLADIPVEDVLAIVLAEATPSQTANALNGTLSDICDAADFCQPLPDLLERALALRGMGKKAEGMAMLSRWYDENF